MSGDPDFELLKRWRKNDRKAGDELVTRYYGPVRRFFVNSVSDDEFQDLTNETFKRLTLARTAFEGTSTVRTFLFRIARNVLYDHLRKRYRRDEHGFDPLTHTVEDVEGVTPSRAVAQLEQYQRLVGCMRALPVDTKLLLELYYWQQLTAGALAEIFGLKPATVRTRVFAAKETLRQMLATDTVAVGPSVTSEESPAEGDDRSSDDADDELTKELRAVGILLRFGPSGL